MTSFFSNLGLKQYTEKKITIHSYKNISKVYDRIKLQIKKYIEKKKVGLVCFWGCLMKLMLHVMFAWFTK
jgi:hypothetical protein